MTNLYKTELAQVIANRSELAPVPNGIPEEDSDSLLSSVITAAELSHMVFPELAEHIPGIITEGFGIVAGPPKLGKSWFTLVIALAVAAGGDAFGKVKV